MKKKRAKILVEKKCPQMLSMYMYVRIHQQKNYYIHAPLMLLFSIIESHHFG